MTKKIPDGMVNQMARNGALLNQTLAGWPRLPKPDRPCCQCRIRFIRFSPGFWGFKKSSGVSHLLVETGETSPPREISLELPLSQFISGCSSEQILSICLFLRLYQGLYLLHPLRRPQNPCSIERNSPDSDQQLPMRLESSPAIEPSSWPTTKTITHFFESGDKPETLPFTSLHLLNASTSD